MNSQPPPFGDPTNIRRENATAVKKGVAFGCGGCLSLILLGVMAMAAIFFIVMYVLRSSEVAEETLQRAQESPALVQELGEPLEMGWMLSGSINSVNNSGTAAMSIPVSGPRGHARIQTRANKPGPGPWIMEEMKAYLSSGTTVDLLQAESTNP